MISGPIIYCWPKALDTRVLLINGAFLNAIAFLLNGPSKIFSFPDKYYMIGIGQILMGYVNSNLIILSLPEMIR